MFSSREVDLIVQCLETMYRDLRVIHVHNELLIICAKLMPSLGDL